MLRGLNPWVEIRSRGAGTPWPRLFGFLGSPDSNRDVLTCKASVLPVRPIPGLVEPIAGPFAVPFEGSLAAALPSFSPRRRRLAVSGL